MVAMIFMFVVVSVLSGCGRHAAWYRRGTKAGGDLRLGPKHRATAVELVTGVHMSLRGWEDHSARRGDVANSPSGRASHQFVEAATHRAASDS